MSLEEIIEKEVGIKPFSRDGGLVYMVDRCQYLGIFRALKKLARAYTVLKRFNRKIYKFYVGETKVLMEVAEWTVNPRKKQPDYMVVIRVAE